MELGYKLKSLRERKRLSQQEIADILDVSQKTYSNYESCKTIPPTSKLIKIGEILCFDFISYLKEKEGINDQGYSNDNLILNYELILRDKEEIIKLLKEKIEWLINNQ